MSSTEEPLGTLVAMTEASSAQVAGESPSGEPRIDDAVVLERLWLDETSWVDIGRGWMRDSLEVYERLVDAVPWKQSRLWRYDHYVEEPRLGASYSITRPLPHAVLLEAHKRVQRAYKHPFDGFALAFYRDGRDGQAFHRDRDLRHCEETVIAILSLGTRRPWLLRPRGRRDKYIDERRGATHDLAPAGGDLIVLGGRCQADWEHSVPQVRGAPGAGAGRISAQWRWTSGRGRPEIGPSYRAPRDYTS